MRHETLNVNGYNNIRVPNEYISNNSDHLAIFLPGVGYTNERPLMYYAAKYFMDKQSDLFRVDYNYASNDAFKRANYDKLREWVRTDVIACLNVVFNKKKYKKITIVCKSIGTLALAETLPYFIDLQKAEIIWLTPLCHKENVAHAIATCNNKSLLIIGTDDHCYDEQHIKQIKENSQVKCVVIPEADHSLEINNDIGQTISVMKKVTDEMSAFFDCDESLSITLSPIGYAYNNRHDVEDDYWGDVMSKIVLSHSIPEESLAEIDSFSHLEIIYYFHKVSDGAVVNESRHPRNNRELPKVGIFAQRGKNRPNKIGLTTVKLLKVDGRTLYVKGLDCINGTPILDIKPVMSEFLPNEPIIQPEWTKMIMENYWSEKK